MQAGDFGPFQPIEMNKFWTCSTPYLVSSIFWTCIISTLFLHISAIYMTERIFVLKTNMFYIVLNLFERIEYPLRLASRMQQSGYIAAPPPCNRHATAMQPLCHRSAPQNLWVLERLLRLAVPYKNDSEYSAITATKAMATTTIQMWYSLSMRLRSSGAGSSVVSFTASAVWGP